MDVHLIGQWPEGLEADFLLDLEAELARDGIGLRDHERPDDCDPIASVELDSQDVTQFRIEIDVQDDVTNKHVARQLDLSDSAASSRSLDLTISTVELLQASWAELALAPTSEEQLEPPPPEVTSSLERRGLELGDRARAEHRVGVEAQARGSLGGVVLVGGNILYRGWPITRLGLGVGLGGAALVPFQTPNGSVTGGALSGSLSVVARPVARPRVHLDVDAGLQPVVLFLHGHAGGLGRRTANVTSEIALGLTPSVKVDAVWLYLRLSVAGVFAGVDATDAGEPVASYSGLSLSSCVGVEFVFPRRP